MSRSPGKVAAGQAALSALVRDLGSGRIPYVTIPPDATISGYNLHVDDFEQIGRAVVDSNVKRVKHNTVIDVNRLSSDRLDVLHLDPTVCTTNDAILAYFTILKWGHGLKEVRFHSTLPADLFDAGTATLELDISGTNANNCDIILLSALVKCKGGLAGLNVSHNPRLGLMYGDKWDGIKPLARQLYFDTTLRYLNLAHCDITVSGASELGLMLLNNKTITSLDIQGNPIKDHGMIHIAHALTRNKSLQHLDVSHTGATHVSFAMFVQAIDENEGIQLKHLAMRGVGGIRQCCFDRRYAQTSPKKGHKETVRCPTCPRLSPRSPRSMVAPSNASPRSAGNQTLDSATHAHTAHGASAPSGLKKRGSVPTLRVSDIGGSEITKQVATPPKMLNRSMVLSEFKRRSSNADIVEILRKCLTLEILELDNQHTTDKLTVEDAQILSRILTHNTALRELHLGWNHLQSAGLMAIAEAIRNPMVGVVPSDDEDDKPYNPYALKKKKVKKVPPPYNRSLQVLDMRNNGIHTGLDVLATNMQGNPENRISTLLLDYNPISEHDCEALAQIMQENRRVRVVSVDHPTMSDRGASSILAGIQPDTGLEVLVVRTPLVEKLTLTAYSNAVNMLANTTIAKIDISIVPAKWIKGNTSLDASQQLEASLINHGPDITSGDIDDESLNASFLDMSIIARSEHPARKLGTSIETGLLRSLTSLTLYKKEIPVGAIRQNHLEVVDWSLQSDILCEADIDILASLLYTNKSIVVLNLNSSGILPHWVNKLSLGLKRNTTLTHLDMGNNPLRDAAATKLIQSLMSNHAMRYVSFFNTQITDATICAVPSLIRANAFIEEFDISRNPLSLTGAQNLAEKISAMVKEPSFLANKNRTRLYLTPSAQNAIPIVSSEGISSTVNWSDLSIKSVDVFLLGALMKVEESPWHFVESIDLSNSHFSDLSLESFATALSSCNVKRLSMRDCSLTARTLGNISPLILTDNAGLEYLNLSNNPSIGGDINYPLKEFGELLANNNTIEELVLNNCGLSDADAEHLGGALEFNHTLLSISLYNNSFEINQAILYRSASIVEWNSDFQTWNKKNRDSFTQWMSADNMLVSLSLKKNRLREDTSDMAIAALKHCRHLKYLDLSYNEAEVDQSITIFKEIEALSTGQSQGAEDHVLVLSELDYCGNEVSSEAFAACLESNNTLEIIHMNKVKFHDSFGSVVPALGSSESLRILNVAECGIEDRDLRILDNALQRVRSLEHLNLQKNSITYETLVPVFKTILRRKTRLESISVAGNRVDDNVAVEVYDLLQKLASGPRDSRDFFCRILQGKRIDLGTCHVTARGAEAFAKTIKLFQEKNPHGEFDMGLRAVGKQSLAKLSRFVKTVQLDNVEINDAQFGEVADGIRENPIIEEIHLTASCRRLWQATKLSSSLENVHTLTNMNLSHNNMCGDAVQALGKALAHCGSVTHLDVSHNSIGERQYVRYFAEGLRCNSKLQFLNISYNRLEDAGCDLLMRAFLPSERPELNEGWVEPPLKNLNLSGNGIGDHGINVVSLFLSRNPPLTKLDLRGNGASSRLHLLSNALIQNSNLRHLYMNFNCITSNGASTLGQGLISNRGLKTLSVADNELHAGVHDILKALQENDTLETIDLNHIGKYSSKQGAQEADKSIWDTVEAQRECEGSLRKIRAGRNWIEDFPGNTSQFMSAEDVDNLESSWGRVDKLDLQSCAIGRSARLGTNTAAEPIVTALPTMRRVNLFNNLLRKESIYEVASKVQGTAMTRCDLTYSDSWKNPKTSAKWKEAAQLVKRNRERARATKATERPADHLSTLKSMSISQIGTHDHSGAVVADDMPDTIDG